MDLPVHAEAKEATGLFSPMGVTWFGALINLVLSGAKIAVGLLAPSQALLADGVHSLSDLVSDVAVLAGLRIAQRPADANHPYGHARFDTLTALSVGLLLLAAAAWIGVQAMLALRVRDTHLAVGALPFWLALLSVPCKEWLFRITRRVGRRTGNLSLIANAWHHRSDAFTSLAAAAGLAGAAFGGPAWGFLDHLTALVLATFLVVVAMRILWASAAELTDRASDPHTHATIAHIAASTPGVRGFHALRTRRLGGQIEMDIHIQVDPGLSVRDGHDIAGQVKHRLLNGNCRVVNAIIHVEPAEP
jgi:cation diffusion facilitator family transporter